MKTMKLTKTCCALMGAATLMVAPNMFATLSGTITLQTDYGNANGGGAFKATTSGLGTFDTFCLAQPVDFYYGDTYDYTTSSSAMPGGAPYNTSTGQTADPISIGTAFLYSQFRSGGLAAAGYVYGDGASANALQQAIWYLEGENLGVNNAFVAYAASHVTGSVTGDANGAFGVVALNLTKTDDSGKVTYYQPQLGMVPEPSTVVAGMLLLLPFGLSTVRVLRKSKA